MNKQYTATRSLTEVIEHILTLIPETEVDFRIQLESNLSSVNFSAPEEQSFWWHELAVNLNNRLVPPFSNMWEVQVIAFFTGKTEEMVCRLYGSDALNAETMKVVSKKRYRIQANHDQLKKHPDLLILGWQPKDLKMINCVYCETNDHFEARQIYNKLNERKLVAFRNWLD